MQDGIAIARCPDGSRIDGFDLAAADLFGLPLCSTGFDGS